MNTWSGPLGLTCTLQIAWWSGVPSKIVPNILVWHTSVARLEWSFRNPDKEISIFIANYTNCHLTHKPHYPEHNRWSLGGEWQVQTQLCVDSIDRRCRQQFAACSLSSPPLRNHLPTGGYRAHNKNLPTGSWMVSVVLSLPSPISTRHISRCSVYHQPWVRCTSNIKHVYLTNASAYWLQPGTWWNR